MERTLLVYILEHLAGQDRSNEILRMEYRMGNGQCPVCYGHSPQVDWGRPVQPLGHAKDCLFDRVIKAIRSKTALPQ